MLDHFLRIHGLAPELKQKLFAEIAFTSPDTLTRGETAYILTKLMEPYKDIPIGYDVLILKAIYERTQGMPVKDVLYLINQLSIALKRVPMDMLTKYGLTKYRLLSDLDAIRRNTLPERKEKVKLDVDTLAKKRKYRRDPLNIITPDNVKHFTRDRYDELDF